MRVQQESEEPKETDKDFVRLEVERVRRFVGQLSLEDLKQGTWFVKLLSFALDKYTTEVDAAYFRTKYPDLPRDAIAQARCRMAANYAGIEGAVSGLAYNGAIAATIGSGGGASPLTLPAGGASFVIDTVYTSYLQVRLAYDLAVIYGVPLDMNDPEDLWKLVRIAFVIKSGEAGSSALLRGVPAAVRPTLKKIFSGSTLRAVQSLPVIGKQLLQRNIIKFGIPLVGVPLSVGVNYWTTRVSGSHATAILRMEARISERAAKLVADTTHHEELMLAMWAIAHADGKIVENERLLLHRTTEAARAAGCTDEFFARFRDQVHPDLDDLWKRVEALRHDAEAIYRGAVEAAAVDGRVDAAEWNRLERLAETCGVVHDPTVVRELAKTWR